MKQFVANFIFIAILIGSCSDSNFQGSNVSPQNNQDSRNSDDTNGQPSDYDDLYSTSDSKIIANKLDLVIAIDSSGSMNDEKQAVETNLNQLMANLTNSNLEPMIHVMVGSGRRNSNNQSPFSFTSDIDPEKVTLIDQAIGSHDALSHISRLLTGMYSDQYKDTLGNPLNAGVGFRPDAKLEILIISDDNGRNNNSTDPSFGNLAENFDPNNQWRATVSAIVGLPSSDNSSLSCSIAEVGEEYINLANQTGGSLLDICSSDWSELLLRFSSDIVKRSHSLRLSYEPADPQQMVVSLDEQILSEDDWSYDQETRLITLSSMLQATSGMEIKVLYDAKYQDVD
ncbi:MAG: hypothetical protein ACOH5I_04145 [Oligoflexus sp.]